MSRMNEYKYEEKKDYELLDFGSVPLQNKEDLLEDLSGITNYYLEGDLSRLTAIATLANIDVSKIKDFSNVFSQDGHEYYQFTFPEELIPGVQAWDVSKAENMENMFRGCTNFNVNITGWDVRNVKKMNGMFLGCESFNQDIGGWNVSNVTDMSAMFKGCTNFNQDIGSWDVRRVRDMQNMFESCTSFNQNIGNWDVKNVSNMFSMFMECTNFNQDLSGWDVRNVKHFVGMFFEANNFEFQNLPLFNMDLIDTKIKFEDLMLPQIEDIPDAHEIYMNRHSQYRFMRNQYRLRQTQGSSSLFAGYYFVL